MLFALDTILIRTRAINLFIFITKKSDASALPALRNLLRLHNKILISGVIWDFQNLSFLLYALARSC